MWKITEQSYITIKRIDHKIVMLKIKRTTEINAVNAKMLDQFTQLIHQLDKDKQIACVIITGENNFITGADVRELNGATSIDAYRYSQKMKTLYQAIISSKKPYIAAIRGYCVGDGFELALACDIQLADDTAIFGFPEINLGVIPAGGGISQLADLAGTSFASQLIMTGDLIDAEQAKQAQLIQSISRDVIEDAISIASAISEKSRQAIAASKKLLTNRKLQQNTSYIEQEMYEFSLLFDQPDAFEGISAFTEKRQPQFQEGD